MLKEFASEAPDLNGRLPDPKALKALVAADANITHALLEAVVPGWDIESGMSAAQKFLENG